MDPLTIVLGIVGLVGAIASAAATADSSTQQRRSVDRTNAQNYRIWQEQKQHNEDMYDKQHEDSLELYDKQKQDNIDFWNMENEYNSITAQMERAVAAGLSPMSVLNGAGTTAGNITSPNVSLPQMLQALAPTMQAPPPSAFASPLGAAFEGAMSSLANMSSVFEKTANVDSIMANTDKLRAEAISMGLKNQFENDMMPWKKEMLRSGVEINWQELDFAKRSMHGRLRSIDLLNAAQSANIVGMELDNEVKQFNNQFLGIEKQISLQQEYQVYQNLVKQGKLTDAQAQERLTASYKNTCEANYSYWLTEQLKIQLPTVEAQSKLQGVLAELQLSQLPTAENIASLPFDKQLQIASLLGVPISSPDVMAKRYVQALIHSNAVQELNSSMSNYYNSGTRLLNSKFTHKNDKLLFNSLYNSWNTFDARGNLFMENAKDFIPLARPASRNNNYYNSVYYDSSY